MAAGKSVNPRKDRLAMAEAAIAALKDDYKEQLQADTQQLSSIWSGSDALDAECAEALFSIAHNLKGQAGTFGYDLVTLAAASLCDLLRGGQPGGEKAKAVGHHISVLNRIVEKDVVGTGGEMGAKVIKALHALSKEA